MIIKASLFHMAFLQALKQHSRQILVFTRISALREKFSCCFGSIDKIFNLGVRLDNKL